MAVGYVQKRNELVHFLDTPVSLMPNHSPGTLGATMDLKGIGEYEQNSPPALIVGYHYGLQRAQQRITLEQNVPVITAPPRNLRRLVEKTSEPVHVLTDSEIHEITVVACTAEERDGENAYGTDILQAKAGVGPVAVMVDAIREFVRMHDPIYGPERYIEEGIRLGEMAAFVGTAFRRMVSSPWGPGDKVLDDNGGLLVLSEAFLRTSFNTFTFQNPVVRDFLDMVHTALSLRKELQDLAVQVASGQKEAVDVVEKVRSIAMQPVMLRLGVFSAAMMELLGKDFGTGNQGRLMAEKWKTEPALVIHTLAAVSTPQLQSVFSRFVSDKMLVQFTDSEPPEEK